ncbi:MULTISPECIES: hypothetical protein [Spirulina sp. CCY15215]|uniref:hypothetical protein n=1 Tax=Spirulina sp. CCY15215 TaxID=2767591 RepID=UPI0019506CAE|nr:hypothetical protein [Spirulina major]
MAIMRETKSNIGSILRKVRVRLGYPINEKLFQVCGIQRSGNHALINWIISQQPLKTCFINGVFPDQNPWEQNWGISYRNFDYWPGHRDLAGALVSKQLLICSYENYALDKIDRHRSQLLVDVGKSQEVCSVLILRDPYNTFASWLKAGWDVTAEITEMWKVYAREFIGQTSYLQNQTVTINFNTWFASQEYRRQLAHALNLEFTDRGLDIITHHGGGSSFDKQSLDGNAKQMNVLRRFQAFVDNPVYRKIFQDQEIQELSEKIFGEIEGTKVL